jgi:hypothetical protein
VNEQLERVLIESAIDLLSKTSPATIGAVSLVYSLNDGEDGAQIAMRVPGDADPALFKTIDLEVARVLRLFADHLEQRDTTKPPDVRMPDPNSAAAKARRGE